LPVGGTGSVAGVATDGESAVGEAAAIGADSVGVLSFSVVIPSPTSCAKITPAGEPSGGIVSKNPSERKGNSPPPAVKPVWIQLFSLSNFEGADHDPVIAKEAISCTGLQTR
jgi:hypothetical protein